MGDRISTTPVEAPGTGRLDREPVSVHARTRLAEEKRLFERTKGTSTSPVVLRAGMVYGRGVLMIEAARWLASRRLLGVWRDPTWLQLISTPDFLRATEAAIVRPEVSGIYHLAARSPSRCSPSSTSPVGSGTARGRTACRCGRS